MSDLVLQADNLSRFYESKSGLFAKPQVVKALNDVSFSLNAGETLAVVGESGCGKSTLARVITMIEPPTGGHFAIEAKDVQKQDWERLRPDVQIVFQNPYASLNPRQKIGSILEEPLFNYQKSLTKAQRAERAREMLATVGLRPEHYERYPHMFSGGQRQRIAIARALMLQPKILVLDEPVSALDVSIQSQILNLLSELQEKFSLAYLFISHDLSVVRHIADRIMVMYLGRAVEYGDGDTVFANPRHPYTEALFSATPQSDPTRPSKRIQLKGELPSPIDLPKGCAFAPRCRYATDQCRAAVPALEGEAHKYACFHPVSGELG